MNYISNNWQELSNKKQNNISDMNRLMSLANMEIDDYSKIPIIIYNDWKILLQMNDSPGPYKNILNADRRQKLLLDIRKWELINKFKI